MIKKVKYGAIVVPSDLCLYKDGYSFNHVKILSIYGAPQQVKAVASALLGFKELTVLDSEDTCLLFRSYENYRFRLYSLGYGKSHGLIWENNASWTFWTKTEDRLEILNQVMSKRRIPYEKAWLPLVERLLVDKELLQSLSGWGGGEILTKGRDFFKMITMNFSGQNRNTLYSTLHIKMDNELISLLNKFDRVMFSLDSYRISDPRYDLKLVLKNVKKLSIKDKKASYTPRLEDGPREYEKFYKMASDVGANVFHIGFLYPSAKTKILPPNKYLELIDFFYNLWAKYKSPHIGFLNSSALKPTESFGWRAFDCFKKGLYISSSGMVCCCAADQFAPKEVNPPLTTLKEFLKAPERFFRQNLDFIQKNFYNVKQCLDCEWYVYCMGGCPYFRSFSANGIDIYCEVYKLIFSLWEDVCG